MSYKNLSTGEQEPCRANGAVWNNSLSHLKVDTLSRVQHHRITRLHKCIDNNVDHVECMLLINVNRFLVLITPCGSIYTVHSVDSSTVSTVSKTTEELVM